MGQLPLRRAVRDEDFGGGCRARREEDHPAIPEPPRAEDHPFAADDYFWDAARRGNGVDVIAPAVRDDEPDRASIRRPLRRVRGDGRRLIVDRANCRLAVEVGGEAARRCVPIGGDDPEARRRRPRLTLVVPEEGDGAPIG